MSDLTRDEIVRTFERQVRLCRGIGYDTMRGVLDSEFGYGSKPTQPPATGDVENGPIPPQGDGFDCPTDGTGHSWVPPGGGVPMDICRCGAVYNGTLAPVNATPAEPARCAYVDPVTGPCGRARKSVRHLPHYKGGHPFQAEPTK